MSTPEILHSFIQSLLDVSPEGLPALLHENKSLFRRDLLDNIKRVAGEKSPDSRFCLLEIGKYIAKRFGVYLFTRDEYLSFIDNLILVAENLCRGNGTEQEIIGIVNEERSLLDSEFANIFQQQVNQIATEFTTQEQKDIFGEILRKIAQHIEEFDSGYPANNKKIGNFIYQLVDDLASSQPTQENNPSAQTENNLDFSSDENILVEREEKLKQISIPEAYRSLIESLLKASPEELQAILEEN